jgi:dihydrofolate reductase
MSKTRFQITISVDGYMAGPNQDEENPLGVGGEDLHRWMFALANWRQSTGYTGGVDNASSPVMDEMFANTGAVVMGRNMFSGFRGPWSNDPDWRGWWGEDPPYHMPVFVLTHYAREPLVMEGGTTFYFVTEGVDAAMARAREVAAGKDVLVGGGANTIQQALAGSYVDEFLLSVSPLLLGAGERPFDNVSGLRVEQTQVIDAPGVTHVRYRVVRD